MLVVVVGALCWLWSQSQSWGVCFVPERLKLALNDPAKNVLRLQERRPHLPFKLAPIDNDFQTFGAIIPTTGPRLTLTMANSKYAGAVLLFLARTTTKW